jgi:hypothetical protein
MLYYFLCFAFLCRNIVMGAATASLYISPPPSHPEHHAVWLEDQFEVSNNFDAAVH